MPTLGKAGGGGESAYNLKFLKKKDQNIFSTKFMPNS